MNNKDISLKPVPEKITEQPVAINEHELQIKVCEGNRVVTFKDIDSVHNRPAGTARKRFNDNKKHFIEGEDYYNIKASDKPTPDFEIPNRGLTVLTESGYLMIVKSFHDDLSWQVQRQLVNAYFKARRPEPPTKTETNLKDEINFHKSFITKELRCLNGSIKELTAMFKAYILSQQEQQPRLAVNQTEACDEWKHIKAQSIILSVADIYGLDNRKALQRIYDTMIRLYGFDPNKAKSEYLKASGSGDCTLITAVSFSETYRNQFELAAEHITKPDFTDMPQTENETDTTGADKIEITIRPLVEKYGDNTPKHMKVYGKVYKNMMTDRNWKIVMAKNKCRNKKQVLMKCDKWYNVFKREVEKLLSEV